MDRSCAALKIPWHIFWATCMYIVYVEGMRTYVDANSLWLCTHFSLETKNCYPLVLKSAACY